MSPIRQLAAIMFADIVGYTALKEDDEERALLFRDKFKVIVLHVGGMEMEKALPEANQINFLPRITQPILMLNGKHDMFFPVETSQKPMFEFIGTPQRDKRRIVYESGHLVPRTDFVKKTLDWYDKYLWAVK